MNSNGVIQFDKIELKNIAIGRKSQKGDGRLAVSDDVNFERDLTVDRDTHVMRNLIVGRNDTGSVDGGPGAVNIKGSLSVSGDTSDQSSILT